MKDQPAEMPAQRIPCQGCGAMILPLTGEYTGGYCMPCANARTFVTDSTGPGRVPAAGSLCNRCGAVLRSLFEMIDGFCESCAKLRQSGDATPPDHIQNPFCE